jgi:spermidine synthase
LLGVVACFVLSGFAALLYQTAWMRQFSLVFGTSELAVAAVLAAYMAGLALGAAVAGRIVERIHRPILWYGLLEAGIALSALAVPAWLALAGTLYGWALGGRPEPPDAASLGQPLFYLGVGFLVLALPTSFMGATLPLLIRHAVRTDQELGPKVALLYAANTGGAVLGTLVAGFLLLPALGLRNTVWVGVASNAVVFAIAAALSRSAPPLEARSGPPGSTPATEKMIGFLRACVAPLLDSTRPASKRLRQIFDEQPGWILPLVLASGATAFVYEVLWTRLLSHVLGGSIYAFATMLAAFLTGIALGGALAGGLARTRQRAALAFAFSQLAIAFLSMGVYAWMGPLLPESRRPAEQVLYAMSVMLPATLFIGATFPLAVRVLASNERQASAATARVYAWNTVGSIAGATLAGFWIIPRLGFEGSIRLGVCANLALGLVTLAFVARRGWATTGFAALALVSTLLFYRPSRPEAIVSSTAFSVGDLVAPRETFHAVGRSSTVAMLRDEKGAHHLLTNGLPEAVIPSKGSPPVQDAQRWLAALPVVARPDARDMLMIGFGGGIALAGVPPSVREIDVVELEPEVIRANRTLEGQRDYDPLADERVRVILNDARNALRLTDKRYDVIVSQPSHPWTAGASHLFTQEFVRSAKAHLTERGVFVQWMNSEFVTAPLLRSLAATLLAEFSDVRLYQPNPQVLVFLASDAPLDVELELARTGRPLADHAAHYGRLGMSSVEDLVAALVMDRGGLEAFAGAAPLSTDDDNAMAVRSRSRADGLRAAQLEALFAPYDALLDPEGPIQSRVDDSLDLAYLTRRLLRLGQFARAEALAQAASDPVTRSRVRAQIHVAKGEFDQAAEALRTTLAADPQDMQARYLLLRTLTPGEADAELKTLLDGLQGPSRAVVEGWQHASRTDWVALSGLDASLARSRGSDAWYPAAARLRALWRIQRPDSEPAEEKRRLAREALAVLEPALVVADDADLFGLYQLRAQAAVLAGEPDVLVESARDIVTSVASNLQQAASDGVQPHPSQLAMMRLSLDAVAHQLEREFPAGTQERAVALQIAVRDAMERIDAAPGSRRTN